MVLPFSLLLGLMVVAANSELLPSLPGAASWSTLLPAMLVLVVPTALAVAARRSVQASTLSGRVPLVPPRALLRLSALATPLAVHAFWQWASYGDWLDQLAWDSHLGRMVLAIAPVFLAEVPRLPWCTLANSAIDVHTELRSFGPGTAMLLPAWSDVAEFARMRLGGPLLVAMPLLLLGCTLDVLRLDERLYALVLCTTPGVMIGTASFLLLAIAVLPFWFRLAFAVQPLPEPIGARLRATARKLGFPPQRLFLLPTGMRALNAMLVGPLPFGRCLCLTDGLVRELDVDALEGVVAHEVGHAKRGHPAILIALVVIVPLALSVPLRSLELEQWDVVVRASGLLGVLILSWFTVRALAHRFEHEADATSVAALGAAPCSRALMVVSRLAVPVEHGWFGRVFTLHPEEPRRWQLMRRYEGEPAFRARFEAHSRGLRYVVAAVVMLALVAGAIWSRLDWPFERVLWRLNAGDHAGALQATVELGDHMPERWQHAWRGIREELVVVQELAPHAVDAGSARAALQGAWSRGEQVLLTAGPAAARPWFALALGRAEAPTPLQRAIHGYCAAAGDADTVRMEEIAELVRRLGVPDRLRPVFGA